MTIFPAVEAYRAELRGLDFEPLDDWDLDDMRDRHRHAHVSNAIEGIHPTPELAALFEMFLEERAPADVSGPFVDRWLRERLSAQRDALAA
ncbi:MAG: hypothetical protein ACRYG4_22505 [Janthinobacterium lividum]